MNNLANSKSLTNSAIPFNIDDRNPTFMSELFVVKANDVNAVFINDISTAEYRFLQVCIALSRESNTGLTEHKALRIHAKRYANEFDISVDYAYKQLQEIVEKIFDREFVYINEKRRKVRTRWIYRIEYFKYEGAVEVVFTPDVAERIARIDGSNMPYTKYYLQQIKGLSNTYAIRLFELVAQWDTKIRKYRKFTLPDFEISSLRGQLGVSNDEYQAMCDFKKRVIKPAVKEINNNTDYSIEIDQVKQGRRIVAFKVHAKLNTAKEPKTKTNWQESWKEKGLSDGQIRKIANNMREFIDANSSKISANDRRQYHEVFEHWKPLLKDPKTVNDFNMVQELLERQAS